MCTPWPIVSIPVSVLSLIAQKESAFLFIHTSAADGNSRVHNTADKLREMLNSEAEQESSAFNEKREGYEVRKVPLVSRNITEFRFSVAVQRQLYQHICVVRVQMERERDV